MGLEQVLEESLVRSDKQPIQVRVLSQSGKKPKETVVFESPTGCYHNTWYVKRTMPDGTVKKLPWTRLVLRTNPVSGFLFPGEYEGFQTNKFKNLGIYLQQSLLLMVVVAVILEVSQVWYLQWGQYIEGVGWRFWKDPWLMLGIGIVVGMGAFYVWSTHEDTDLKVIYLQSVRDIEDDQGRTFYVCTRAFSFRGMLNDLGVDTPDEAFEAMKKDISTLARKNNPGEVASLKKKVNNLQYEVNNLGGASSSEVSKQEHEHRMFIASRNQSVMLTSIIVLGGVITIALWFWSKGWIP